MSLTVDVLTITDLRFPGGNSSSLIEELKAQARAGMRSAILHIPSSVLEQPSPLHPGIREALDAGIAIMASPYEPITAAVTIIAHPTVITALRDGDLDVNTEQVLVKANHVPREPHREMYSVPETDAIVTDVFRRKPIWAGVGPEVLRQLQEALPPSQIWPSMWFPIIDSAAWSVVRQGPLDAVPVIGRVARDNWGKWPERGEDILAVYPDDPSRAKVRVLGGAETVRGILGRIPESWDVLPYGALSPAAFMATIDFHVYYHHRNLREAFGRTVLEAMAAGAIPVLPPHFMETFGDAAVYATTADALPTIQRLHASPDEFLARSEYAATVAAQRFSYQSHIDRLTQLRERRDPSSPAPTEHHSAYRASSSATGSAAEAAAARQAARTTHTPRTLVILPTTMSSDALASVARSLQDHGVSNPVLVTRSARLAAHAAAANLVAVPLIDRRRHRRFVRHRTADRQTWQFWLDLLAPTQILLWGDAPQPPLAPGKAQSMVRMNALSISGTSRPAHSSVREHGREWLDRQRIRRPLARLHLALARLSARSGIPLPLPTPRAGATQHPVERPVLVEVSQSENEASMRAAVQRAIADNPTLTVVVPTPTAPTLGPLPEWTLLLPSEDLWAQAGLPGTAIRAAEQLASILRESYRQDAQ